jgi:hypothetical protein
MPASELTQHIFSTLLYYEIFDHPLTMNELYYLFPRNSLSKSELLQALETLTTSGTLRYQDGFYMIARNSENHTTKRLERQHRALRRMMIARFMGHIIKRIPFVRGVFISGDLSKGVAYPNSDIDYVIIAAPGRLWICRSMLVMFKKIFLLNKKKYFCLNYYVDTEHLTLSERDYYIATEVAHLKPLFNFPLFLKYMNANGWIKEYFPNFRCFALNTNEGNNRPSILQKMFEFPFAVSWADTLDTALMNAMQRVWKHRYPEYDDATREKIFRCSRYESRAFIGNFNSKILTIYQEKLQQLS